MKYVRGTRVWRDLRLLYPPGRWTLRRGAASRRRLRATGRVRRARGRTDEKRRPGKDRLPREVDTVQHSRICLSPHGVAALLLATSVPLLGAQSAAPVAYRAPTIALVQPLNGGTVPRDKPVVVFRFARGEASDPIDVRTFAVSVDGVNRTAHFQVTADEAWGSLFKSERPLDSLLAAGPHAVAVRVCSVRGACAEATSSVVAIDAPTTVTAQTTSVPAPKRSTRARVIELVLDAVRKLIVP